MADSDAPKFLPHDGQQWLVLTLREASKVKRCHTIPCHHTPTVGEHSGNMIDLLLALHPDPSVNLIRAIRLHDVPERWLGDMPAPTKKMMALYKILEDHCIEQLAMGYSLSKEDADWIACLDILELIMWAWDERAMGNQNVTPMLLDCGSRLGQLEAEGRIPEPVGKLLDGFSWARLSDYIPGMDELKLKLKEIVEDG